jgi:flagellar basal-body rod protein FlgF
MQTTGRSLDVAIDGAGFFKVQGDNEIFYTRSGHLMLDKTACSRPQKASMFLAKAMHRFSSRQRPGATSVIDEWGGISVNGIPVDGRLQVFAVNEPQNLIKSGTSRYRLEEGEGDQPLEAFRVIQGNLETSNVNMLEEMTTMIATQRAYEAHHKVLGAYSKLGEKQDELGSVGS